VIRLDVIRLDVILRKTGTEGDISVYGLTATDS